MWFERKRRYISPAISILILILILVGASCKADELQQPAEPQHNLPVTDNKTAAVTLDIISFIAQPKTIKSGEQTVLSWKVTGANSLSIDQGIGNISQSSGSLSISPKTTTLYTLTASDGRYVISGRFLVIVKTAEGAIVWPSSSSENITAETMYEGWSYYPNKYVEWTILDRNRDTASDAYTCWHQGRIINKHNEWIMTQVTVSGKVVASTISPSEKIIYVTSMDCLQLPDLKWKWKLNK
jgi:hypothetical protein